MAKSGSTKTSRGGSLARNWANRLLAALPAKSGLRIAFSAAALVLCFTLVVRALSYVQHEVAGQKRYLFSFDDIQVTPQPVWVNSDVKSEVHYLSGQGMQLNSLDKDLVRRLRYAFALHPWIRTVRAVHIDGPQAVCVEVEYREPVALVHTAQSLEPIDGAGVLLPGLMDHPEIYLAIKGIESTPTGPAGTQWKDPRVLAAARTSAALTPEHRKLGLVMIDMTQYRADDDPESAIFLWTNHGTRVKFGHAPESGYPREPAVAEKLARLRQIHDKGLLDPGPETLDIDITHWYESTWVPRGKKGV